ncbi:MAG: hypothetical protein KDD58_00015 [Bdellovibrionales bacterium]|nr:hypothetical protein [Bdellovibrionales bacterium]
MTKKKKDVLVDDLMDELNDSTESSGKSESKNYYEEAQASTVDFYTISNQTEENEEGILELDIDLPDINKKTNIKAKEESVYNFTEIYEEHKEEDDALREEELVQAYEETLATEMVKAVEVKSEVKEVVSEDPLDHTEKVDLDLFNISSPYQSSSRTMSPTESMLAESENLRIAKIKIKELQKENEKLSIENEELAAAAETFRNKVDQLEGKAHNFQIKYRDLNDNVKGEKEILLNSIAEKDREIQRVSQRASELENRLQMGLRKIKVRERELENRLELIKLESKALVKSKDEMILNLKRQLDKLNHELESLRSKIHESNKYISQKQEVLRKTVKTLRLALSLLEAEDFNNLTGNLKKVD